ncbi:UNVERIFIED_CONTAM: hypothetical protein Sradi_5745900 [Sesamum radiatum]|uniref:Uncharacterized protein n=1 Tax=Sesamum radiatum TaxID=300843 RepID=A0AAW2L6K1_SESRA
MEDCFQLKDEIERSVRQGYFKEYILQQGTRSREYKAGERRTRSRSRSRDMFKNREREEEGDGRNKENAPVKGVINTIAGGPEGGDSRRLRKRYEKGAWEDRRKELIMCVETEDDITFTDIIFRDVSRRMGLEDANLSLVKTPVVGFAGSEVSSIGTIDLLVLMGEEPKRRTLMVRFSMVDTPFAYNVILGRPGLNLFRAVVSKYHQKMKFPTKNGIREVSCDQKEARKCYNLSLRKGEQEGRGKRKERDDVESDAKRFKTKRIEVEEQHKLVELVIGEPDKTTRIGSSNERNTRNFDGRIFEGKCIYVCMESFGFQRHKSGSDCS